MFADALAARVEAAPRSHLDEIAQAMWTALAAGAIDEAQASTIDEAIERRRKALTVNPDRTTAKVAGRVPVPLRPEQRQAAIERRRRQAASGALPPEIAAQFTIGEQAALAVIAHQIRRRGPRSTLAWFTDRIAALAGVSRSTARNAIRKAKALGIVRVVEQRVTWWRNGANIISIVAAAWQEWLRGGVKNLASTITKLNSQEKSDRRRLGIVGMRACEVTDKSMIIAPG